MIQPASIRDRIGIDIGRRLPLEEAIPWAARHQVRAIDVELDRGANALTAIDAARAERIRAACDEAAITLALHTSSSVNVAEVAPFVGEAVDRYLTAYIDAAAALGAAWIVVHAGYHFSSDVADRMEAGLARLHRAVAHAEEKHVLLLLENLNVEPQDAEIHYLAHTLDEWRFYLTESARRPSASPSPPTTRISCRRGSPASSTLSTWPKSTKSASPIATASAARCI
jgi:sugar phosphate isomerase/epimerase